GLGKFSVTQRCVDIFVIRNVLERIAGTGCCSAFSGSHMRADNRQPSGMGTQMRWIVRVLYWNSVRIFIS
ncbi:MAG: hypothetical protein MK481_06625, partial [SAR324 cluster bacterium]|nr:hypothetical protein [SAR324 cluster bacterium]